MEQQIDIQVWLSEHVGRQARLVRLMYGAGAIEYRVEKGADEWMLVRRFRLWHPFTWLVLVIEVVVTMLLSIIIYPFVVVKICLDCAVRASGKKVVDCSACGKVD